MRRCLAAVTQTLCTAHLLYCTSLLCQHQAWNYAQLQATISSTFMHRLQLSLTRQGERTAVNIPLNLSTRLRRWDYVQKVLEPQDYLNTFQQVYPYLTEINRPNQLIDFHGVIIMAENKQSIINIPSLA